MTSDRLFVYGTLMRGFDHPEPAPAVVRAASTSSARRAVAAGSIWSSIIPGWWSPVEPADIVFGEVYRLRARDELLREFDMYEACGADFPEPTQYVRKMLPVALDDGAA